MKLSSQKVHDVDRCMAALTIELLKNLEFLKNLLSFTTFHISLACMVFFKIILASPLQNLLLQVYQIFGIPIPGKAAQLVI